MEQKSIVAARLNRKKISLPFSGVFSSLRFNMRIKPLNKQRASKRKAELRLRLGLDESNTKKAGRLKQLNKALRRRVKAKLREIT